MPPIGWFGGCQMVVFGGHQVHLSIGFLLCKHRCGPPNVEYLATEVIINK